MAQGNGNLAAVDPITYEVVRNRLWSINDQQALMAGRISGSPTIYEANDFNTAIMDRDGGVLFIGVYVTLFGITLTHAVQDILQRYGDEIHDGDMFISNDPWVGALHMNDMWVVAPIFHGGERVAWTGIAMHESDVGGPVPGSFVVGATDVFGECALIPPLKLVEGGKLRREIERLLLRNTRTPALNALNIRARVSALTIARERILSVVERYGRDTFLAILAQIKRHATEGLKHRLTSLPDGEWSERLYIDHDGNNDIIYPVVLKMIKQGARIVFDFTGTAKQAPGMVNCTRSGLYGGLMAAVLPMLCYDMPWTAGGLSDVLEIISEEGTINNALFPAAVSMAPISGAWMTMNLANACIGKMLASSEAHRVEAQACWLAGWHGMVLGGLDQRGQPMAGILMDAGSGGSGARIEADGVDAAGLLSIISNALPNVETNERHYPILTLYRRHGIDSAGAGRFRGGVGAEMAFTPHKNPAPIMMIGFSTGADYPAAPGMFGGQAGSVQRTVIARGTDVWEQLGQGRFPDAPEAFKRTSDYVVQVKDRTILNRGDVQFAYFGGGGGYGDPLDRDLDRVQQDLDRGLCRPECAETTYGAVLGKKGHIDVDASTRRRAEMRVQRLRRARPARDLLPASVKANNISRAVRPGHRLGDAYTVNSQGGLYCQRCETPLGAAGEDPRGAAVVEQRSITDLSPLNRFGRTDIFTVHAFYCPNCGSQLSSEVQLTDEPIRSGDLLY